MRAVVLDAEGADSLVVHLEDPDGGNGELLLFVALAPPWQGAGLDDALRRRIPSTLRTALSPRHVPDRMVDVPVVPRSLTGKAPGHPQAQRGASPRPGSGSGPTGPAGRMTRWTTTQPGSPSSPRACMPSNRWSPLLDEALAPLDLRVRPYTALTVLAVKGGLSSAELARRAFMRAQSMQDVIRTLEARGLVERRAAERDRRVLLVAITDAGREVVRQGSLLTAPIEQLLVTGTDPDALAAFDAVVAHGRAALARAVQQSRPVPNRSALGR
jgi:DNA-binding MarR family transcriptional regulator